MKTALISKGFIDTIISMKYCIECNAPKSYKGVYCKACSYKHRTRPSGLKYNIKVVNRAWIKKGQTLAKGIPRTEEHRRKLGVAARGQRRSPETEFKIGNNEGEANKNWKGDKVGYYALHAWVARHKERLLICQECGKEGKTHFANIDFKYTRDLKTWRELCQRCHTLHDVLNGWGEGRKKFKELRNG